MKRVGIHDTYVRCALGLMIVHPHKVGQKDEGMAGTMVLELKVEVVDNQEVIIPVVPAMTCFLQCLTCRIGFQITLQCLCNGSNLFLLTGKKGTDDELAQNGQFLGFVPQAVINYQEVFGMNFRPVVQKSRCFQ